MKLRVFVILTALALASCAGVNQMPSLRADVHDLGHRASATRVTGIVVLRDRRYDELQTRVEEMADPASPSFHHFLSPGEFMERYAPSSEQEQRVIDALGAAGFSIDRRYENRGALDVSATTADAERFFSTQIDDLGVDGARRFGNVRPLIVPGDIAPYVLGVILNDWERGETDSEIAGGLRGVSVLRPRALPEAGNPLGKGPGTPLPSVTPPAPYSADTWSPSDVANAFNFPVQSGWNGAGVTVANIVDGQVASSDFSSYMTTFHIRRTGKFKQILVSTAPNSGGDLEATLDSETIAGLSPGADLIVYVIPNLSFTNMLDGYTLAVSKHKAIVVNTSFGACDQIDTAFDQGVEQDAVNGNALGMSFSASSGDFGVECFGGFGYHLGVGAPASAPNVTGVGGNQTVTSLTSSRAWNTCAIRHTNHTYCSTNGGISSEWKMPSFQRRIRGSFASTKVRNVPDVAFPAYGTYNVLNGSGAFILGTSWASPEYVSLLVQAAQACKTSFGDANVTTYAIYKKYPSKIVEDVVTGNNDWHGVKGYRAGPDYDNTTGLGLPLGSAYAAAMCGKSP